MPQFVHREVETRNAMLSSENLKLQSDLAFVAIMSDVDIFEEEVNEDE